MTRNDSCCLNLSHRHFSKRFSPPKTCTNENIFRRDDLQWWPHQTFGAHSQYVSREIRRSHSSQPCKTCHPPPCPPTNYTGVSQAHRPRNPKKVWKISPTPKSLENLQQVWEMSRKCPESLGKSRKCLFKDFSRHLPESDVLGSRGWRAWETWLLADFSRFWETPLASRGVPTSCPRFPSRPPPFFWEVRLVKILQNHLFYSSFWRWLARLGCESEKNERATTKGQNRFIFHTFSESFPQDFPLQNKGF